MYVYTCTAIESHDSETTSQSNNMGATKETSYTLHSLVPFKFGAIKRKQTKGKNKTCGSLASQTLLTIM